jgi:hypothetical protein
MTASFQQGPTQGVTTGPYLVNWGQKVKGDGSFKCVSCVLCVCVCLCVCVWRVCLCVCVCVCVCFYAYVYFIVLYTGLSENVCGYADGHGIPTHILRQPCI